MTAYGRNLRYAGLMSVGLMSLLVFTTGAYAQDQPQTDKPQTDRPQTDRPQADKAQTDSGDTTVTVKGQKAKVVRKVDRTVYTPGDSASAQSGTAADVLKTVPSVTVSPNGDVSLRGNSDVQVYINGKPSAEMSPEARAITLQAMSGSDIASVEVITNPSAQYSANGGGIINLVLKPHRKPGLSGAVIVNQGDRARNNITASVAYTAGKLTLTARAGFRHDVSDQFKRNDLIWTDPLTGHTGRSVQQSFTPAHRNTQSAALGLGYVLNANDSLNANLTYSQNHARNQVDEFHQDYDSSGDLTDDYDRRSVGPRHQSNTALHFDYDHRGATGDELKLTLNRSETINHRDKSYRNIFAYPTGDDTRERLLNSDGKRLDEASLDYGRPIGQASQISAGLDVQHETDRFFNYQASISPGGIETVNTQTTNRFIVDQAMGAAYVTVQIPHGKWTILSGLRLETLQTDTTQVTTGVDHHASYSHLNPSLHVSYTLDEARQIKASFSDSLQRPAPADLNPFTVYADAQNVTAGNPNLRPQKVSSAELGYEVSRDPLNYSATLYYRTSRDTVTDYAYFLADNVLLTTKRNSGQGRSGGLDTNISGQFTPTLKYSLSLNGYYAELMAADINGVLKHSGLSYTGNGDLSYEPNDTDSYEISSNFQGRSLTSQGQRSGYSSVDMNWRHHFTPKLALFINVIDIGNAGRIRTLTKTASVNAVNDTHFLGRVVYVGLNWTFARKLN